jgi:hypothetical protein
MESSKEEDMEATASVDVLPSLDMLPHDCAASVLSFLPLIDICHVARTSCALRLACSSDSAWEQVAAARGMRLEDGKTHSSFQGGWCDAMDAIDAIEGLSDAPEPSPVACMPARSMSTTSAPVLCSAPSSLVSVAGSTYWSGISGEAFVEAVRTLQSAPGRRVGANLLVDWLHTTEASSRPLLCLAVVAALESGDRWESPRGTHADGERGPAGLEPPPIRQLLSSQLHLMPRALRLPRTVWVKWHTWSNLRDCRGFRARDDLHRGSEALSTLAAEPSHEIWGVLARGVTKEVRDLRVGVD